MVNTNDKQYIFLDESGKPEVFSAKGINLVEAKQATKYLILAAVRTNDQLKLQQNITDFKAQLLKIKLEKFTISVIKNTSLGVIRSNYPVREVHTVHVSLSGLF
jgi:hypothetical protein